MTAETLELANRLTREIREKTDSYNNLTKSLNGVESNMMWLSIKCYYNNSSSCYGLEMPKELMIEAINKSIVYYEEEIDKLQKQLDEL